MRWDDRDGNDLGLDHDALDAGCEATTKLVQGGPLVGMEGQSHQAASLTLLDRVDLDSSNAWESGFWGCR
jgi:hypothetical protein